ncbi:hypothetical protein C3L33_11961, partial [Rhododendron williamsianum]
MPQNRKTHKPKKSSSQKCRNNEAKTLEKKEETGIDRLSDLPEPIIHKILLCLPLSDAINTEPLSRRWRHSIWSSCPILFLDEYYFEANYFEYDGERRRFAKLLKSLQKQKEGASNYSSIEKFGIRMALLGHEWDAAVDGWVKFAVENEVKELDLRIKRVLGLENCLERYWLDDCVFACRSLTALYLDYCLIRLDCVTVDLPSLKRLTLSEVEITNNSFRRLIGGCPSVEYLCVEFCKGLQVIKGSAPNLKSLKLNLTDVYLVSLEPLRLESVELILLVLLIAFALSMKLVIFPGALCERLLPPLHDLKHLKLEIRTLSTSCSAIVDGLIWLFPGLETLTIKSGSINKLIKVT